MIRFAVVSIGVLALLAGCGQVAVFGHVMGEPGHEQPVAEKTAAPAVAPKHVFKSVTLDVRPMAAPKLLDEPRFDSNALLDAIRQELTTRKLLDEQGANAEGMVSILLSDLDTHPTTNATIFGHQFLSATLTGDVHVTGDDRKAPAIIAEARVTIAEDGKDKNPFGPLYRQFATLTADRIAGTVE